MRNTAPMMLWPGQLYPESSLYDYQLAPLLQLWDKIHKALKPLAREQILSPPPNPYTHSRSLNSREEQGFREQTPGKSRSQQEDGNPCCGWPEQSAPAIKSGSGKTFGVWSPSTIPSDSMPRHSQPKSLLTVTLPMLDLEILSFIPHLPQVYSLYPALDRVVEIQRGPLGST